MSFGDKSKLFLATVLLVLWIVTILAYSLQRKRLEKYIHPKNWSKLIPSFQKNLYIRSEWFHFLGIFLCAIALIRPQWGEIEERFQVQGRDVLVLLDVSNSMLAEDTPPSRLSRAQQMILRLGAQNPDFRIGVLAFAGKTNLTIPLTNDLDYLNSAIETVNPEVVSEQGTQIGLAIKEAIQALNRGSEDPTKKTAAIVLITDGEDFGQDAAQEAKRLKELNVPFFILPIGTEQGAPIPIRDMTGALQTYKKDSKGQTVMTKVDRKRLSELASEGNAKLIDLLNSDDAAYQVSKELRGQSLGMAREMKTVIRIERFQIFLGLGLFLLLLGMLFRFRKTTLSIIFIFGLGTHLQSKAQTISGYLESKKGIESFEKNEFGNAAKHFQTSRQKGFPNSETLYNEGTSLIQDKESRASGRKALEESAKTALNQGDFSQAAKSLYNQGIASLRDQDFKTAYQNLSDAIEAAKIAKDQETLEKARAAFRATEQQQQKQQNQNKDQEKKDQEKKDSEQKSGQESTSSDEGQERDNQNQNAQEGQEPKKNEYQGKEVSKETAEQLMNDLSDREKQLYLRNQREKRGKVTGQGNDW